jgi:predicted amidohydrolase
MTKSPASSKLIVGTASFVASETISHNAETITSFMREAARAGVRVLATPECALIGYPTAARPDLSTVKWCSVAEHEEDIELLARQLNLVVILGTASLCTVASASADKQYSNDAYVVGLGDKPLRYRKRGLTPSDEQHFIPGTQAGIINVDGWHIGLSICYELRFGALWAEQASAGADLFLSIAHMAGGDVDPGTKNVVIPNLYSARAAEWATPLVLCNTAVPERWVASGYWDARGVQIAKRGEGLGIYHVTPRSAFAPWYHGLRREALRQEAVRHAVTPRPFPDVRN